ncbi:hypothetical protein RFI_00834, partial [Reticulomyxa filosa]
HLQEIQPISLLSGVGKLLERIITMRLMWYLNENRLLHNTNNTSELLLRMTESIYSSFNNSVKQDEKRIWIERLDSFLKDRIGQVVLNGISSNERKFEVGVPQGPTVVPIWDVALWTSIYTSDEKEMEQQLKLMQTNTIDHVQDEGQKEISKDELKLNGSNIEEADYVKYLGLFVIVKIVKIISRSLQVNISISQNRRKVKSFQQNKNPQVKIRNFFLL